MAYADIYRRDRLFLPQQKLLAFARVVPTPFYLYDEDGIRKTARLILGSFRMPSGHRAYFPVSVNNAPAILRIYREEGFGALVCSAQELELARSIGFGDILFHTAGLSERTAEAVGSARCGVILDAPGQLEAFSGRLPERCLLRWHPEKELQKAFAFARRGKSGMDRAQVIEAAKALSRMGVPEIGLHCHVPGSIQAAEDYPQLASLLLDLAAELRSSGVKIRMIDPGGGLPACAEQGRPQLHMSAVGARMRRIFEGIPDAPVLCTELGRSAIARHGIAVSRVLELRERTRSFAILDISVSQLGQGSNPGSHRISVVGNCARSGRKVYCVHGCTPSSRELLCDRTILPPLSEGTLVALHGCGANAQSMQTGRFMLPPCGGYLFTCDGRIVPLSEHQ